MWWRFILIITDIGEDDDVGDEDGDGANILLSHAE